MSEVVNVTGTPQLAMNIGGTGGSGGATVEANYASGSGTNQLVFTYTILAGQNDTSGISINANAITLNGGTIRDPANNNATLTAATVTDNAQLQGRHDGTGGREIWLQQWSEHTHGSIPTAGPACLCHVTDTTAGHQSSGSADAK